MKEHIEHLLQTMVRRNASDLHLVADHMIYLRVHGRMVSLEGTGYTNHDVKRLLQEMMSHDQFEYYTKTGDLDFSINLTVNDTRFRANAYRERGRHCLAMRAIREVPSSFNQLGLPDVISQQLSRVQNGLILVTGPSSSGKSTTVAAMVEWFNQNRRYHIITIEDPIEFYFQSNQSLISQRQVGEDTQSFSSGLRYALRQDPDVILVGEMRDLETVREAVTTAETGHLVLATLHSSTAVQAIHRLIDIFPGDLQNQVRTQLSLTLKGIFSQRLILNRDKTDRVPAVEILFNSRHVLNAIRKNEVHTLYNYIETGGGHREGMQTMDMAIVRLYLENRISKETALQYVSEDDVRRLRSLVSLRR